MGCIVVKTEKGAIRASVAPPGMALWIDIRQDERTPRSVTMLVISSLVSCPDSLKLKGARYENSSTSVPRGPGNQ